MNLNWIRKRESLDRNTKYLNIIIICLVIIGTLLLTYTFYQDRISHDEVKGYFIYYCFSIGFIVFWLIIFFFNNNIRINIIISTISFVIGLLLLETILYALGYSDTTKLLHKSVTNYDTRTGLEVINDLKKDRIDAVPNLSPLTALSYAAKDLVPMGGISNKTVVATNESGQYMVFKSDRYGFNNPDFEWDNETVDWLLVGDSYAQGLAVQTGEDIGGQIRKLLKQYTINQLRDLL